jgi:hypothetical protein
MRICTARGAGACAAAGRCLAAGDAVCDGAMQAACASATDKRAPAAHRATHRARGQAAAVLAAQLERRGDGERDVGSVRRR